MRRLVVKMCLAVGCYAQRLRETRAQHRGRDFGFALKRFGDQHACGIRFAVVGLAQVADVPVLDAKARNLRACVSRGLAAPVRVNINAHGEVDKWQVTTSRVNATCPARTRERKPNKLLRYVDAARGA